MRVFLSFHFDSEHPEHEQFVHLVFHHLLKQPILRPYCYRDDETPEEERSDDSAHWRRAVGPPLRDADRIVVFLGREVGRGQEDETADFLAAPGRNLREEAIVVEMPECTTAARDALQETVGYRGCKHLRVSRCVVPNEPNRPVIEEKEAQRIAHEITQEFLTVTAPDEASSIAAGMVENLSGLGEQERCEIQRAVEQALLADARQQRWIPDDGLPIGYPFEYEKAIIEEFVEGGGYLDSPKRLEQGCPYAWPGIARIRGESVLNPVSPDDIGAWRAEDADIIVDARTRYHPWRCDGGQRCLAELGLTFPEAGPRQHLVYPLRGRSNLLRVGIVVSGGIAPGINAVISGIVSRHELYKESCPAPSYVLDVRGYQCGFPSIPDGDFIPLHAKEVATLADRGGSIIGTSRSDLLLEPGEPYRVQEKRGRDDQLNRMVTALANAGLDILYVIGGDGSMRAAHALWTRAQGMLAGRQINREISIVGVPKTMDNDILWVWQSFGFASAFERARELIVQLHTEVRSNPRLGIIQLFGSDSGFVVSHAALASGVCALALIPESEFSLAAASAHIRARLQTVFNPVPGGTHPHGLVLMAETVIPRDVDRYVNLYDRALGDSEQDTELRTRDGVIGLTSEERKAVREFIEDGRRVHGQTPDCLRSAGLKIVSRTLQRDIRMIPGFGGFWRTFRVFTNEPRHLLRAIDPSAQDVIIGQRMGALAVDNAMAGYTDFMISQWLTEYVLVPLKLAVLGRKRVPQRGIFWKNVRAKTGQGDLAG